MENLCESQDVYAKYARGFVKVDLEAIRNNMIAMKANIAPETKMIGVIKTDGYGHGSVPVAKKLEDLDFMYGFAVATAEEAFELRSAGITLPILILGYTFPYCYEELIRQDIRPAVFREDQALMLNQAAAKIGKKAKIHLKTDTGMGRIGITPDEDGFAFVKKAVSFENLEIEGIFTHFARADEFNKDAAFAQLEKFKAFTDRIKNELEIHPLCHCSNSAGILEIPEANMDIVRAGITLYGLAPSDEVNMNLVPLTPALSWYSTVAYVKEVPAGTAISYGGTFVTRRPGRIATVPVGYGDGYPRSLSNKGYVLIDGQQVPIAGRVCMDQFMLDVTDFPSVKEGDRVVLIGQSGEECITAEMLGDLSGRFNYELVCDIGKRMPRVYE